MNKVEQRLIDQSGTSVILQWLRKTVNEGWGLSIQLGRDSSDVYQFGQDPNVRSKTFLIFTEAQNESLAYQQSLITVPARSVIDSIVLEVIEGFTGTGISALDVSISSPNSTLEIDAANALVPGSFAVLNKGLVTQDAEFSIDILAVGANLSELTTGQLAVHIKYETLQ